MLKITMNNWWLCVHSDVLSARENLLSEFKYFAQKPDFGGGDGGSKSDRVLIASTKPHCTVNYRNRGRRD
jgi:hypothetical protein